MLGRAVVDLGHHHHREGSRAAPRGPAPTPDRRERGASLVEYALLLSLIAIVAFSAVGFFGGSTEGGFDRSRRCMDSAYAGNAIPDDC